MKLKTLAAALLLACTIQASGVEITEQHQKRAREIVEQMTLDEKLA